MAFTDLFIRRPVLSITLSLMILLVGIASFFKLHMREFPRVDASVVSINTVYSGASAEVMEGFVTTPIENAISSVEGIDYIRSTSESSSSQVTVVLHLGYDIHQALNDISSKINGIRSKLPKEIEDPVISQNDPNAEPTIYIACLSQQMRPEEVADYLERSLQPQLQTLPGVGEAKIFGDWGYAMRIWLDPIKMAAYHVTATDVQEALLKNNVQSAAGNLEGNEQIIKVMATTDLNDASQFNNIYIRNDNGRIVRIRDIGKAELGSANNRYVSIVVNGQKSLVMGIIPQSTANPLEVSKAVNQLLATLEGHYPKDLQVKIVFETAQFIHASLHEVQWTLIEAVAGVFIIIFLMIGSWRAVFIPTVTIPLSIIGAFMLMMALHYSLNILTFLAFVLAIGLVVDDAIVVLENIHRHLQEGKSSLEAALIGAREIALPVVAMTLTLAAVYAPIGFASGLTGKFFAEFAFTLAGAVIFSGLIALTLSPMMCSVVYRSDAHGENRFEKWSNGFFEMGRKIYQLLLRHVLNYRYLMVVLALVVYGSCYFLFRFLPQELVPTEDEGVLHGFVMGPSYANLSYIEARTQQLQPLLSHTPEITFYGLINGVPSRNNAWVFMSLKPWEQRKRSAMEINQSFFPAFASIPGVKAIPLNTTTLPGAGGMMPVNFVLKSMGRYEELQKYAKQLMAETSKEPGFLFLDSDLKIDQPQVSIDINRNKATDLGISMRDIGSSLNLFLGEPIVSRFNREGRSYDVLPMVFPQYRMAPSMLGNLYVRTATASGGLVPLSNLATIRSEVRPESLNHFQEVRSAVITGSVAYGMPLGTALDKMTAIAKKILPKDVQLDYAGASRMFYLTTGGMAQVFLFALLFIYLVLAAQFESFRDPFIVMFSVPLSLAGGLGLLILCHGTLNLYTQIAFITLIGLITKHGILIVEFINQARRKGMEMHEAIVQAAALRLRPILMTTSTMLLGALPLVMASGAGAVSRRQIGLVIMGGMAFGTLLTLFVVPIAYSFLAPKKMEKE